MLVPLLKWATPIFLAAAASGCTGPNAGNPQQNEVTQPSTSRTPTVANAPGASQDPQDSSLRCSLSDVSLPLGVPLSLRCGFGKNFDVAPSSLHVEGCPDAALVAQGDGSITGRMPGAPCTVIVRAAHGDQGGSMRVTLRPRVVIAPLTPRTADATTILGHAVYSVSAEGPLVAACTRAVLNLSTDKGENWQHVARLEDEDKPGTFHDARTGGCYISVNEGRIVGTFYDKTAGVCVYLSTTFGQRWRKLGCPMSVPLRDIKVRGDYIHIASTAGYYYSWNMGREWNFISTAQGLQFADVLHLSVQGNEVYLGHSYSGTGYSKVTHYAGGRAEVRSFSSSDRFTDFWSHAGVLYAGGYSKVSRYSLDKGQSWIDFSGTSVFRYFLKGNASTVFAAGAHAPGLAALDYGSLQWRTVLTPSEGYTGYEATSFDVDGANLYYGADALYISKDNGASWRTVRAFEPDGTRSLVFLKDGTLLSGSFFSAFGRSESGGKSWTFESIPTGNVSGYRQLYDFAVNDRGRLLALSRNIAMYFSDDGGKNWTRIPSAPTNYTRIYSHNNDEAFVIETSVLSVYHMDWIKNLLSPVTLPVSTSTLRDFTPWQGAWLALLTPGDKILRSINKGQSWDTLPPENMPPGLINAIEPEKDGSLLTALTTEGIFQSSDGLNWTSPVSPDPLMKGASAWYRHKSYLVVNRASADFLVVSADGGRIWQKVPLPHEAGTLASCPENRCFLPEPGDEDSFLLSRSGGIFKVTLP